MPTRPARKGFAPCDTNYGGFRDKVGIPFRAGKSTFVLISYKKWGPLSAGKIPARFFRSFAWEGDKLGAYRLDTEYTYFLNHEMVMALGNQVSEKVPHDILERMRLNSRLVLETNWAVADEFETLLGDVEMRPHFKELPDNDLHAYLHCGTLLLALTPTGRLKVNKAYYNFATGFQEWTNGRSLDDMMPAGLRDAMPNMTGLQPCGADYSIGVRMPVQVARGGGPELANGEEIKVGADELVVWAVEHDNVVAADDPLASFGVGYSYITGNPYDDPLTGVEMLDHERLGRLATDPETLALLAKRDIEQRLFLNNNLELLPGWRVNSFARATVRRVLLVATPAMLEGLTLLRGAGSTRTFECAVAAGGKLVPLRRCSEALARVRVASLAGPSPCALRDAVQAWLHDVIKQKASNAGRNLDPLEFTVPCSYAFFASLPFFAAARRSPTLRHVLSYVISGVAEADTILAFLGWHAPMGKEQNGFFLVVSPDVPQAAHAGATLDPRKIKLKKHQYNFFSYDTETQALTVRLSLARFNASVQVRGASVGAPPTAPAPGGGAWKYSLLERAWVARSVRAPTPKQLKERYPSGPEWLYY